MFTGLIQDVGTVEAIEAGADGARLRIGTELGPRIGTGDSVAVDGICLTATRADAAGFETEVMNQTLEMTTLARSRAGSRVNLELAMKASDRLGGHIVQGHVDGPGEVIEIEDDGFAKRLHVALAPEWMNYVIPQGSIALNGVSLTIAELDDGGVVVSLIPETLNRTNLGEAEVRRELNVELDLIGKYVERIMGPLAGKEQR